MTPAIQQRKLKASMTSIIVIQKDPHLHKKFSVSMINIFNVIDLFKRYQVNSPTYLYCCFNDSCRFASFMMLLKYIANGRYAK